MNALALLLVVALQDPQPITVTARPAVALPRTPIKFFGTTVADGKRFDVTVTIVFAPSGERMSRRVRVDSTGAYSLTIATFHTSGDYKVSALAPDGKGSDTTSFQISDEEEMLSDMMDALRDINEAAKTVARGVSEEIKGLPESPGKQELEDKIKVLEDSLRVEPERVKQYRDVMQKITDFRQKHPESETVFHSMFAELGERAPKAREDAEARQREIQRQLDESKAGSQLCDRIDTAIDGLKAIGAIMNLSNELMSITKGFFTDYLGGKYMAALSKPPLNNESFQLGMSNLVKLGIGMIMGPVGWAGFVMGFANDAAQLALDRQFKQYCDRFEGPFSATMHGEVYNRQQQPWWIKDIRYEGRLMLRYPKTAAGKAVKLTGQFEGTAAEYKVWDDALPVLYPQLMRGARTFKKTIVPVALPYVAFEGRYAALMSPAAFSIPVEGELVGRRLTIRVQAAKKDVSETYNTARAIVAILSPLALIPVTVTYPLPFHNAEFVVKNAFDANDGAPIVLDIEMGKNTMQVQRNWNRTRPGEGVKAIYTATLHLCNPVCDQ